MSTSPRNPLTVGELENWVDSGATWRPVEITDARAVVELCTCYGEPVDLREGVGEELIEYVRARRHAD
jgi:hypothetical protein